MYMIWIFEGSDPRLIDVAKKQIIDTHKPDNVQNFVWFSDHFDEIVHHAESQDLFSEKSLIVSGVKKFSDSVEHIETLHSSKNLFILQTEKKLLAPERKKIKNIPIISCFSEKKEFVFNIFSFSDALITRNKKDIWVLYQKAIKHKIVPDEIVRILLWQCKNMLIAGSSKQGSAGLKPFVESKARQGLKNFTVAEIRTITESLTDMYQKSRYVSGFDLGVALERFILSL